MILIVGESIDYSALWLRERLAARVAQPVRMITPTQLLYARSIVHHLSVGGSEARFILASGETIDLSAVGAVINRVAALPFQHLQACAPAERAYAEGELHAFMLGLLAWLPCPVVNVPAPEWIGGPAYGALQALQLAVEAGLPCEPASASVEAPFAPAVGGPSSITCFVMDGRFVGPQLPSAIRDAVIHFADLWGARLVQIQLEWNGQYRAATSFVDYRAGGDELVDVIAEGLTP